ncbi:MAG: precorrin-2 C(20)-methyltransferase [Lachnospiraceae bacterium]|nr:precorrin-2 C(20)-methyltransferase [Lachnospiraceae bacterium]
MKGMVYGVGVGPGDPEDMTLKAVRLIRDNEVIALPGKEPKETVAYRIAVQAVPELADKMLMALDIPMLKDFDKLAVYHREACDRLEAILDSGRHVVYLTLGDPTLYCSFSYLQHILEEDGYEVKLVNGVSSVFAAAARLGEPLAEWGESVHILPQTYKKAVSLDQNGTCVLMKSCKYMDTVKAMLRESGRRVTAVENCGMPNEKVYRSLEEIPDDAGYYTLIIAKEARS